MDIDGVLNNIETFSKDNELDADNIKVFNEIVEKSGANVVISSSWRICFDFDELKQTLEKAGLKANIIDITPIHVPRDKWKNPDSDIVQPYQTRGHEIQAWLDEHPTDQFIIVDDNDEMSHLSPKLLKTKFEYGLTSEHVDTALKLFNK